MAIQQSGPRDIGFFGTRNMGFLHQQLIEILSYAMVLTVRQFAAFCPAVPARGPCARGARALTPRRRARRRTAG